MTDVASRRGGLALPPLELLVDGAWTAAADGARSSLTAPADGSAVGEAAAAGAADVDAAVQAAARAFTDGAWPQTPGSERRAALLRLADLIDRDAERLDALEQLQSGQPAAGSAALAAWTLRGFAGWADAVEGREVALAPAYGQEFHTFTEREAVGVVGVLLQGRGSLVLAARALGAALAAGCAAVVKPAQGAPLAVLALAELTVEAGFPSGVVNVVPGSGDVAGATLAEHPDVDATWIAGSSAAARAVGRAAAPRLARATVEPRPAVAHLVLADADVARAVAELAAPAAWQAAGLASRVLVHASQRDALLAGLAEAAARLRVGDPFDGADVGALTGDAALAAAERHVAEHAAAGGEVLAGGERVDGAGRLLQPTVVRAGAVEAAGEDYAPVLTVAAFDELDTALDAARGARLASIWTRDVALAQRSSLRLGAELVAINAPCDAPARDAASDGAGADALWRANLARRPALTAVQRFTEEKTVGAVVGP